MSSSFGPVSRDEGKIAIKSLDEPEIVVVAQFNPKELQIDKPVGWEAKPDTGTSNKPEDKGKKQQGIGVQFGGAKGRSITVELLFDGFEKGEGAYSVDVSAELGKLEHLASVRKPGASKEDEKRPHWCVVNWGGTLTNFRCVIESLTTKYTMFDTKGAPLRATCTVKLMEADYIGKKKG